MLYQPPARFVQATAAAGGQRMVAAARLGPTAARRHVAWSLTVLAALTTSLLGCDRPDPIRRYTISTSPPESLQTTDRMLGLIVAGDQGAWFFKLTGPAEVVEQAEPSIRDFLESLRFVDDEPQLDELPPDWSLGEPRQMRFATLLIETPARQLELAISQLPRSGSWDEQVAMNVNRWRGQMGLDESDEDWAGAETFPLEGPDQAAEAAWVDLTGQASPGPAAMAARSPGPSPPPATPPNADPPNAGPSGDDARQNPLRYDVPPGWREGRMSSMRLAAFEFGPEEQSAELTVIPAGGDLRGNVQRWIGEVQGQPPSDEVVQAALESAEQVRVAGMAGQRYFLEPGEQADGDANAIDGTIIPLGEGFSLFIKATGPAGTLREQRDQIAAFLDSIRLQR